MAVSCSTISRVFSVKCCAVNGNREEKYSQGTDIRLGWPSKGRLAEDAIRLFKDCQLSVKQVNPRRYVAEVPQLSKVEVWFQQPKDIVQKLVSGDLDLGFVGLDTVCEYGQGNEDLIYVHHVHGYGDCRLSLAIPKYGIFEDINSLKELAEMPHWTPERPLRVASGFTYLGPKFLKDNGLKHVEFSAPDGFLEAAPQMGIADAIIDLVSSGTTLRNYNLKEIDGGVVLESQAVFVASRKSLIKRKGVLEMIERLEARLRAVGHFTVNANIRGSSSHSMWQISANMRGGSEKDVAERILSQNSLSVLQGPTINPVFCKRDGEVFVDYYASVICVPKEDLFKSLKQLHEIGGSGFLVLPSPYTFDEESIFEMLPTA